MKRLDRSTSVPIADRFKPMIRPPPNARVPHDPLLRRAVGDHHLLADVCPRLGPRDAQRPPAAQAADQLAFESTSAFNVEGLVDGPVRDTHGFVIREVDLQPVGNLFGRPAIDPLTVTAMRLVAKKRPAFAGLLCMS